MTFPINLKVRIIIIRIHYNCISASDLHSEGVLKNKKFYRKPALVHLWSVICHNVPTTKIQKRNVLLQVKHFREWPCFSGSICFAKFAEARLMPLAVVKFLHKH